MQRQTYTLAQLSHRYMFESKEKNAFAWFFFWLIGFFVSFCSFPCWEIDWSCIVRAVKCRKLDEMKSVFEIEIEHNKLANSDNRGETLLAVEEVIWVFWCCSSNLTTAWPVVRNLPTAFTEVQSWMTVARYELWVSRSCALWDCDKRHIRLIGINTSLPNAREIDDIFIVKHQMAVHSCHSSGPAGACHCMSSTNIALTWAHIKQSPSNMAFGWLQRNALNSLSPFVSIYSILCYCWRFLPFIRFNAQHTFSTKRIISYIIFVFNLVFACCYVYK